MVSVRRRRASVISEKEKKITAYHEAGHAILFHVLPDVGPVYTVSIIPTGMGAAGYTMPLPEKDEMFNTKGKMLQNIMVASGRPCGRGADLRMILPPVHPRISNRPQRLHRAMVTKYGMSEKTGSDQLMAAMRMKYLSDVIWHIPEATVRKWQERSIGKMSTDHPMSAMRMQRASSVRISAFFIAVQPFFSRRKRYIVKSLKHFLQQKKTEVAKTNDVKCTKNNIEFCELCAHFLVDTCYYNIP